MTRAKKMCSWRDRENPSIKCVQTAEEAPNGDDFRCRTHWRASTSTSNAARRRRVRPLTREEKEFVRERDWHVCRICGAPAKEVDHIVEVADGGTNVLSNLQLLCSYHHRQKTTQSRLDRYVPDGKVSARADRKRRTRRMGLYQQ